LFSSIKLYKKKAWLGTVNKFSDKREDRKYTPQCLTIAANNLIISEI